MNSRPGETDAGTTCRTDRSRGAQRGRSVPFGRADAAPSSVTAGRRHCLWSLGVGMPKYNRRAISGGRTVRCAARSSVGESSRPRPPSLHAASTCSRLSTHRPWGPAPRHRLRGLYGFSVMFCEYVLALYTRPDALAPFEFSSRDWRRSDFQPKPYAKSVKK